jgi:alpha-beta hydrolase superfamily lysophospholipase
MKTCLIRCPDGVSLHLKHWECDQSTRGVLIIHGLGEHGGRYEPLARVLNKNGYSVFAPDLRGHGKSPGIRGHIASWALYIEDIHTCVREIKKGAPPNSSLSLFGHSMGGLIAITAAETLAKEINNLIISSPCLRPAKPPGPAIRLIAKMGALIKPETTVDNGLDPRDLTHVKDEVVAYQTDPLVHPKISFGLYAEMSKAMNRAKRIKALSMPTFLILGGKDPICDARVSRQWFDCLTSPTKTLKEYPKAYHEVLNEWERDRTFSDIISWINYVELQS